MKATCFLLRKAVVPFVVGFASPNFSYTKYSMDCFLSEDNVKSPDCSFCNNKTNRKRNVTDSPIILHLSFLTRAGYEIVRIPEYLDKEVSIDNVNFDIIGATYGSGSHFKFRYYFNGKVYEADGMRKHSTSRPS